MPTAPQTGGFNVLGVVYLGLVLAVVFVPMVLGRRGPSPGQSDSDSDDGGGGGKARGRRRRLRIPRAAGFRSTTQSRRERDCAGHERLVDLLPARNRRRSREPRRRPPLRTPDKS